MPRARAGGGRGGQGGSGTFDGRHTHVLRVWAGAEGWVGLGAAAPSGGRGSRSQYPSPLHTTGPDPNAQSQGPPDCGQSPDLPQRDRVCVGRAWAGGCGGWHARLSGHTAPPPQAQLCFGGGGGVGTPVRSTVWVLLGVVCCGPRQWGRGTTTLRAPGDLGLGSLRALVAEQTTCCPPTAPLRAMDGVQEGYAGPGHPLTDP